MARTRRYGRRRRGRARKGRARKRYQKRRLFRRNRAKRIAVRTLPRLGMRMWADKVRVKLPYTTVQSFHIDPAHLLNSYFIWRGNGPQDPATWANPLQTSAKGFNYFANLYWHYRVNFSKISIKVTAASGSADSNVACFILPGNSVTPFANHGDVPSLMVMDEVHWNYLLPQTQVRPLKIAHARSTSRALGDRFYAKQVATAGVSTNPTEEFYWHTLFRCVEGNAVPVPVQCVFTITYYCEFYERKVRDLLNSSDNIVKDHTVHMEPGEDPTFVPHDPTGPPL